MILDDGKNYHQIGNLLVENDALRIAQAIKDYDEDLDLICLDPDGAGIKLNSAPFMVVCKMPNGTYQMVFDAWTLDDRILERLWASDRQRFDQLATIDSINNGIKMDKYNKYREKVENEHEITRSIIASNKSHYNFTNDKGDKVRINESGIPSELNRNRRTPK